MKLHKFLFTYFNNITILMNEEQLKFLIWKTYLVTAINKINEEDIKYMKSLNPENITKEEVKKLQKIAIKMTNWMWIKDKIHFWKDLITLIKLWNQQKTIDWASSHETLDHEKPLDLQ